MAINFVKSMSNYLESRRQQKLGIKPTDQQIRAEKKAAPIKKVSDKRKVEDVEYRKVREKYLAKHPGCEAHIATNCQLLSSEIHHKRLRLTKDDRINEKHFLATCRNCHLHITAHPKQAIELGLSESHLKTK